MLIEVKVPQLSESVAEATLLAWHKKQGEAVKRDENLIDIETDKVVLELPAPADGVLVSIVKGDKSTVVAGEIIARIDTEGKASVVESKKEEIKEQKPKPPKRNRTRLNDHSVFCRDEGEIIAELFAERFALRQQRFCLCSQSFGNLIHLR